MWRNIFVFLLSMELWNKIGGGDIDKDAAGNCKNIMGETFSLRKKIVACNTSCNGSKA